MSDWGVGMPAAHWLDEFGAHVSAAFDSPGFLGVYLVGSATRTKKWRDVDVRVILTDGEFALYGRAQRVALELAFAALGKAMTGLPIDFQIQQQTDANKRFPTKGNPRSALIAAHQYSKP